MNFKQTYWNTVFIFHHHQCICMLMTYNAPHFRFILNVMLHNIVVVWWGWVLNEFLSYLVWNQNLDVSDITTAIERDQRRELTSSSAPASSSSPSTMEIVLVSLSHSRLIWYTSLLDLNDYSCEIFWVLVL